MRRNRDTYCPLFFPSVKHIPWFDLVLVVIGWLLAISLARGDDDYRAPVPDKLIVKLDIFGEQASDSTADAPFRTSPTKKEIEDWKTKGIVPPKPPAHSHRETGGKVCPWCDRTCWMVTLSEQAARRNGTTMEEEFQKRYGASPVRGHGYSQGGGWYPGKYLFSGRRIQ